jgi:glycosyltransferase involved in cell wall biosynthesis
LVIWSFGRLVIWSLKRSIFAIPRRCDNWALRILHAVHDFLPRHCAGSEIYTLELCRELASTEHVTVVCAEFDPSRPHGEVSWRVHDGLPVVEIVNNWVCSSFEDTYRSPRITEQLAHVLRAVQPHVLHVHNLLNLSFELTALARARNIPIVATLHDYTLVCASGGQRVHRAAAHVCETIDTDRCARCFRESPYQTHVAFGRLAAVAPSPGALRRAARSMLRVFPSAASAIARTAQRAPIFPITSQDIDNRLGAARRVFDEVDLFVAPSPTIAREFEQFGIPPTKLRVADYGFVPISRVPSNGRHRRLRIGFVGTLVWHKGAHVLIDAVRRLPNDGYELKLFGDPTVFPDYTADLRTRANGLPIEFMGPFGRTSIRDVYAQIDVLVVPSLWLENSPLVIHEAFMAGVPVIGARIGGIADLIQEQRNGLLYEPTSAADLAAALESLLRDRGRLAALAANAPAVKTIADDARDWRSIYAGMLADARAATT